MEVKVKLTQAINHFLAPIHERRARYAAKPQFIEDILISGNRRTLREASETMHLVWEATGMPNFRKTPRPMVNELSPGLIYC